jgi:hypothetical protein
MKGGTKIIAFITICIILLAISFSGCYEDDEKDEDKNNNGYKYPNLYLVWINAQKYRKNYVPG